MHNLCLFVFCVVSAITSSFAGGNFSNTNPNPVMTTACGQNMTNCEGDYSFMEKRQVQGDDRRKPVPNTWIIPFSSVVLVGKHCTGHSVGPKDIVVLGACVHSGRGGKGYLNTVTFDSTFMSRDSLGDDVVAETYRWERVVAAENWLSSRDKNYNIALIVLARAGILPATLGGDTDLIEQMEMDVIGFRTPSRNIKRSDGTMWKTTGTIVKVYSDFFDLEVDKMMTGSGVFWPGSKKLYGIITDEWIGSTGKNRVLRINEDKIKLIQSWIDQGSTVGVANPKS